MTSANPCEGIPLGYDYDYRSQTVCLPSAPLPGHTFILGHTGAGTEHVMAKVATHQAAAGTPTVILDPRSNIRRMLDDNAAICCHDIAKLTHQRQIKANFPKCAALLLYAEYPYPSQSDMTAAAQDAIGNLQLTTDHLNTPGLLIVDHYYIAADLDWNSWSDRTQNANIHTMFSVNHHPHCASGIKRPIPMIANADAIILRTTSDTNLAPVLHNSNIDDDLSLMTNGDKSFQAGYLWIRAPRWSAFFTDTPR